MWPKQYNFVGRKSDGAHLWLASSEFAALKANKSEAGIFGTLQTARSLLNDISIYNHHCRTYFLASIMQYKFLSRQMAHLNHLVIIMTVRTVRCPFLTSLIWCMIVLSVVSTHMLTCLSQNIKKSFCFKFWWDQELDLLKEKSINPNKILKACSWKAARRFYMHPKKIG